MSMRQYHMLVVHQVSCAVWHVEPLARSDVLCWVFEHVTILLVRRSPLLIPRCCCPNLFGYNAILAIVRPYYRSASQGRCLESTEVLPPPQVFFPESHRGCLAASRRAAHLLLPRVVLRLDTTTLQCTSTTRGCQSVYACFRLVSPCTQFKDCPVAERYRNEPLQNFRIHELHPTFTVSSLWHAELTEVSSR
jgi:hypothetical protein